MSVINALPYLEDEAIVTVWGQPGTLKQDLWRLAAATAFSLVKRHDIVKGLPPVALLMTEYDAAANVVRFTVRYRTNLSTAAMFGDHRNLRMLPVFNGPGEHVLGDVWNFTGKIAGLPGGGGGRAFGRPGEEIGPLIGIPKLGFKDMYILSTSGVVPHGGPDEPLIRTPNPRPVGDLRSKGALVDIIYAALATPDESNNLSQTFPEPPGGSSFTPDLYAGK